MAATDLKTSPAVDQHINHNGKEYTTIREGLAYILIPAEASKFPQTTPKGENQPQSVFYNPIQQFNRDLSVLAIKAYGEDVVENKRMKSERTIQRNNARKEKKRKREEDGLDGKPPRKAGKLLETPAAEDPASDVGVIKDKIPQNLPEHTNSLGSSLTREEHAARELDGTAVDPEVAKADSDTIEATTITESNRGDVAPKQPKAPSFTILDALSATGLRALRYAKEIPFSTSITANDLLPEATKLIQLNVQHNKLEDKVKTVTGNALSHMYSLIDDHTKDAKGNLIPSRKYDVIDLDPYGTAVPFLDAAVQSVRDEGGLLCVTCTDAGVWASNGYPEKSFSLYGGIPMKGVSSHEAGLRLILHSIATAAAKYGLSIEPLLSLSIDFYARVFVRVHKSPADVKFLAGKTMVVHNCDTGCGAWSAHTIARNKLTEGKDGKHHFWKHVFAQAPATSSSCEHCGMKMHVAGPMWGGPIHSPKFIRRILDSLPNVSKDTYETTERVQGMLTVALEEMIPEEEDPNSPTSSSKTKRHDPAALDPMPFLLIPSVLAKVVHCVTPHENALRGALRHLGYHVTRSHTRPGSIKTNASWEVIWEIMREWTKQKAPVKNGAIREGTAGWRILGLDKGDGPNDSSNQEGQQMVGEETGNGGKDKKKLEVVFDEKLGKETEVKKLLRYQLNPRENWGPMNRAKGHA